MSINASTRIQLGQWQGCNDAYQGGQYQKQHSPAHPRPPHLQAQVYQLQLVAANEPVMETTSFVNCAMINLQSALGI